MRYDFTKVAGGIDGAEGPVFDRTGRFFCVEPHAGKILQIELDGSKRQHANTGGIPAGLAVDAENHVWVADMKLGVLRVSPDGDIEHVVREFEGKPIRGCNDLAIAPGGDVYFTAPAGSGEANPVGEVFCRLANGLLHKIDDGFAFCNGIAIAPDATTLIVAETHTKSLWAYDESRTRRLFARLTGAHHGGPDGIDFDIDGNLLATNWGGSAIEVFDPGGSLIEMIATPFAAPSNLHFGGADGCDLWITEHTNHAVWRTRWHRPGLLARRDDLGPH